MNLTQCAIKLFVPTINLNGINDFRNNPGVVYKMLYFIDLILIKQYYLAGVSKFSG